MNLVFCLNFIITPSSDFTVDVELHPYLKKNIKSFCMHKTWFFFFINFAYFIRFIPFVDIIGIKPAPGDRNTTSYFNVIFCNQKCVLNYLLISALFIVRQNLYFHFSSLLYPFFLKWGIKRKDYNIAVQKVANCDSSV